MWSKTENILQDSPRLHKPSVWAWIYIITKAASMEIRVVVFYGFLGEAKFKWCGKCDVI